nr:MAG TPA: hypothetical protein [Caudoviricetes sp.]
MSRHTLAYLIENLQKIDKDASEEINVYQDEENKKFIVEFEVPVDRIERITLSKKNYEFMKDGESFTIKLPHGCYVLNFKDKK